MLSKQPLNQNWSRSSPPGCSLRKVADWKLLFRSLAAASARATPEVRIALLGAACREVWQRVAVWGLFPAS